MLKKIIIFISCLVIFVGLGYASEEKTFLPTTPLHPHSYPFTATLGEKHHVRLLVDHPTGEMALVFEDISEKPIKLVRLKRIKSKAIFPDLTVKEEIFRAVERLHEKSWIHRHQRHSHVFGSTKRLTGKFITKAEWIKTTPQMNLKVVIPFEGQNYPLNFQYKVQGDKIPFHSKY